MLIEWLMAQWAFENDEGGSQGEPPKPEDKGDDAPPPAADKGSATKDRVRELSEENAKRRNENKDLKGQIKTLGETVTSLQQANIVSMREAAAAKHKLPPELADRLRGESKADIEKDAEALAKLIPAPATEPPPNDKGKTSTANPGQGGKLTLDDVKKMSPRQINARWADVQAVLAANGR